MKRSKNLVSRSPLTATVAMMTMLLVPIAISIIIAFFAKAVVKEFADEPPQQAAAVVERQNESTTVAENNSQSQAAGENEKTIGDHRVTINIGVNKDVQINDNDDQKDESRKLRYAFKEALTQIIYLPISIVLLSFFTIVTALLYLKTRQAGGESLKELLYQFEDDTNEEQRNWQRRIRLRLAQTASLRQTPKHNSRNT